MRTKKIEISGQVFGRLVVIRRAYTGAKDSFWVCRCQCGTVKTIRWNHLKSKGTISCGCHRKELATTHGLSGGHNNQTHLFRVWCQIRNRCYTKTSQDYKYYGGKGVVLCEAWESNYANFNDWAMAHGYKKGLTIDRLNSNKSYSPENCQWITQSENSKRMWKEKKQCKK